MPPRRIAIIGAGLSGLTLARHLAPLAAVRVFEKSRGLGGRMATRRVGEFRFDHGAQFFTARSASFRQFLAPFLAAGQVAPWQGRLLGLAAGSRPHKRMWFEPHYVAVPGMSALCGHIAAAAGLAVETGVEVAAPLARVEQGWLLADAGGRELGSFDWVISTAPPAQSLALLGDAVPADSGLRSAVMLPCHALMVGLEGPSRLPWIAARVREGPLDWIAVDSSKPGRDAARTAIVAHARAEWSECHVDAPAAAVEAALLAEFGSLTGLDCAAAACTQVHRWRYARPAEGDPCAPLLLPAQGVAAVGDWCAGGRVESVWRAADALGRRIGRFVAGA